MEADWEVEIGGGAPVIEACWSGLVDLRREPERAAQLAEVRQFPAMAEELVRLNARGSPVWTSKCDVFVPEEVDPDELDMRAGGVSHALACYVDLLPRNAEVWASCDDAVSACRGICDHLRGIALRGCRVDLVIRQAAISPDQMGFGVTAYITAAGRDPLSAEKILAAALGAFVHAVGASPCPESAA
jgi:hypothetical protein